MIRSHFFPVIFAFSFLLISFTGAQEEIGEVPSVLPPGTETEISEDQQSDSAVPNTPADSSVPPEKAKSAVASVPADTAESLDLTPEQEEQLHQITKTLFQVPASRTNGNETDIVEIPLPLREAMAQVPAGPERIPAVEAYWELRSLIAIQNIETEIKNNTEQTLENLENSGISSPEFQALISTWRAYLSSCTARISEIHIEIRSSQINLMRLTRRSVENGWPIPSSLPWYGNYSLESESAQARNFVLASEAILIPEKIKTVYQYGFGLGPVENLFKPEITSFGRIDDGYLYLKTIENKRLAAIGYIRIVESLNGSIARYVNAYSATLDSRTFVNCLIGSEEE